MAKKKSKKKPKKMESKNWLTIVGIILGALGIQLLIMGLRLQWNSYSTFNPISLIALIAAVAFLLAAKSSIKQL